MAQVVIDYDEYQGLLKTEELYKKYIDGLDKKKICKPGYENVYAPNKIGTSLVAKVKYGEVLKALVEHGELMPGCDELVIEYPF